jgi:RNA polymerase sigma-70 factor (ECF subfamily)
VVRRLTEQELIQLCKDGDRQAFNQLIAQYQNQVFNIAYGMLSDYEDASDASQEVFVKVYRSIASFRGQSSFSTWIYRICANVCNDSLRKRQRRGITVSIENDDDDNTISEIPSDTPTPEENVMMNERQRAVREAINSLSDEYREIIVYSDINQLSYDEISQILKCPVGTIKSRLNRARNALKKILSAKRELF